VERARELIATTGEAVLEPRAVPTGSGQAASVSDLASRRVVRPQAEDGQPSGSQITCLLRIAELAGSAADPAAVAADALDLFALIVPCVAASVSAWNPLEDRHVTIASASSPRRADPGRVKIATHRKAGGQ